MADVASLHARPAKEREAHEKARHDAQVALLRVQRAADRIRQMTRIYLEREKGIRGHD